MKKFLFLILICSLTNCIHDDEYYTNSADLTQTKNSFYIRKTIEMKDSIMIHQQGEDGDPPPKEFGGNNNKPSIFKNKSK